ncbi:unnamed protein product [Hymenolepis diminuta]|uniref:MFS domain-containing protein n=1 Tax=Hymenolepis diminuta TaxID=6216 RepID=A0A0R3SKM4_HYMDI|nr:unnamed protein product [Hymenolepis diminuta]VUZ50624.1 unnamed protein product [Hymenolepis diminuta]
MPDLRTHDSEMSVEDAESTSGSFKLEPPKVDAVLQDVVKPFGFWQIAILTLCIFTDIPTIIFPIYGDSMPSKFHCQMEPHIQEMLLPNKTTPAPSNIHQPKGPLELSGNSYPVSFDKVASAIGPWGNQTKKPGCHRYKRNYSNITSLNQLFLDVKPGPLEACPWGYVYEADEYQYPSGIAIEWDLVCDREWLVSLSTSMYMFGMMPGMWIGGMAADAIGRRPTANLFWVFQMVVGIACSFAPDIITFVVFRFLLGFATVARANALLILPVELTTAKYRYIISSSMCVVQGLLIRGLATLAAYYIPYWRWLHLAIVAPLTLGVLQFWIIPESPRWLLSKKRTVEAAEVLYRGYLINLRCWRFWRSNESAKLHLGDFINYFSSTFEEKTEEEKPMNCCRSFCTQLKQPYHTKYLLKVSVISTFLFTAQAACLIGVMLYARIVKGYVYIVALINNLTGIPGTVLSAILYAKIRRRRMPLLITSVLATLSLVFGGAYAAVESSGNDIILTISSNIALILCTAISNMILTYVPELYPSCIRSQGLGNAAGIGRLGATIGTFVNSLDEKVGHGIPLLVYAGFLLASCFALAFLPDTTGENLQDVIEEKDENSLESDEAVKF